MTPDDQRALAARKKLRRAAQLTREASRELAQAFDCDVIAATRVKDGRDAARCVAMLQLALDQAQGPIDVTVTAPVGARQPTRAPRAQEDHHAAHAQR